jgi:hypothetical protein
MSFTVTKPKALLARANDLAADLMVGALDEAGCAVTVARDAGHLTQLLAEPWQVIEVSTSVASCVQLPWREVLVRVAKAVPSAVLVLETLEWSPLLAGRLRPEFSLVGAADLLGVQGTRGVMQVSLDQLRDASERHALAQKLAHRLSVRPSRVARS